MVRILILLVTLSSGFVAKAQWSWNANIKVYNPTGSFNRNVTSVPAGISSGAMKMLNNRRLSIGGELGIAMYSNKTYDVDLATEGQPGLTAEMNEEDCFWTLHAVANYYFVSTAAFRAYGQTRFGLTNFFSSKTSTDPGYSYLDDTKSHGTAFNSGLGGGISVNGNLFSKNKDPKKWWIDVGANFLTGSKSKYRNIKNKDTVLGSLNNGEYRSLTNYLDLRLGVSMAFK